MFERVQFPPKSAYLVTVKQSEFDVNSNSGRICLGMEWYNLNYSLGKGIYP